jgi:hypothetical protein
MNAAVLAGTFAIAYATAVRGLDAAQPDDAVVEGHPVVTQLGSDASAMTYWRSQQDGWHVVTIVQFAPQPDEQAENYAPERYAVVRFSSVLLPGQSQMISVPLAVGEPPEALRIARIGERITVARVPGV